ncbi:PQQ-binding-like beta-propeller repeat protein [candidate division KSB1 bacterium]|nr:PQQ-binding-like beta-propeller repeat protein [candidate division KSB1 bacterium]
MKNIIYLASVFTGLTALCILIWWIGHDPAGHLATKVPGMDNRPEHLASSAGTVRIGQYFQFFDGVPGNIPGIWPHFRGLNYDNRYRENISLTDDWGVDGPSVRWSVELGEGHAAPAIYAGQVYVLDYDENTKSDALRCFSLADGREIWRRWYAVPVKRNHGMSRTIPAVTKDFLVTMGPKCHVMCVEADSGGFLWGMDLVKDFGTTVPLWYTGQCPVIDDTIAVIAPGGSSLIMGVGCRSGRVVWKTPNPNGWLMSHSSVVPAVIHGKKTYVYAAVGGMVGVSADTADIGQILWETDVWNHQVIAPSPVVLPDGKILMTAGYAAGGILLQVNRNGGLFTVEVVKKWEPGKGLTSDQQTPVIYKEHFFAVLPKDAGTLRNQFVCCPLSDPCSFVWTSGKTHRYGLGPYILADEKFYILNDVGVLSMLQASTKEFILLGQAAILDGHDAWGPFALVDGLLLARDSRRMVCVDLKKQD